MKTLLISAFLLIGLGAQAQTKAVKDASGNYVAVGRDSASSKPTGNTITVGGKTYPVYISVNGKLYFNRVSKKGNTYKSYITL